MFILLSFTDSKLLVAISAHEVRVVRYVLYGGLTGTFFINLRNDIPSYGMNVGSDMLLQVWLRDVGRLLLLSVGGRSRHGALSLESVGDRQLGGHVLQRTVISG